MTQADVQDVVVGALAIVREVVPILVIFAGVVFADTVIGFLVRLMRRGGRLPW